MQCSPISWLPVVLGILCTFSSAANAAPPREAEVQGYYEGSQSGPPRGYKLADAFAAALATDKKAELVTGDPEFKPLEKESKSIGCGRLLGVSVVGLTKQI